MKPIVTIYVPSHNYGRFLEQSIQSVLSQSFKDWELILIDDGSQDQTASICERFKALESDKIKLIKNDSPLGLQSCANLALKMARGEYLMRLDADDYLDESALLVMVNFLQQHPDLALVYPNYVYVNEEGQFLAMEDRKRIGKETRLLDLPAHGACTLIRKRVLKSIGGYSEQYSVQDGYDLWLKVLHRYPVGNVSTPLFFYRQHGKSQTKNEEKILETRRRIKRERAELSSGPVKPTVVAVIGAKNTYQNLPDIVWAKVGGKPLIDYSIESALAVGIFDEILVSTDDPRVVEYCKKFDQVTTFMRSSALSGERITTTEVALDATVHLEKNRRVYPDIIVYLNIHAPLRQAVHIQTAVDTLLLYNSDVVVSVYEDLDLHYLHGENGLQPLSKTRHQQLRIEREALYVNNGALRVTWRDALTRSETNGLKIAHIVMTKNESFQIKTPFDLWLIERILSTRQKGSDLPSTQKINMEVEH